MAYVISAGLPDDIRELMGWRWSERHARRYRATLAGFRLIDPVMRPVVKGMLHLNLLDLRIRRRLGLRVF